MKTFLVHPHTLGHWNDTLSVTFTQAT